MLARILSPGSAKREESLNLFSSVQDLYTYGGSLFVKIHGARNVRAADPNGLSDPYCVVLVGGDEIARTPVKSKTLNPDWDYDVCVPFLKLRQASDRNAWPIALEPLVFQLWDRDYGAKDDPLGCTRLWPSVATEEGGCLRSVAETAQEAKSDSAGATPQPVPKPVLRRLVSMHPSGTLGSNITGELIVSANWENGNAPALAAASGKAAPSAQSAGKGAKVAAPHKRAPLCDHFEPQRGFAHLFGGTDATLHVSPPPGPEMLLDLREDVSRWEDGAGGGGGSTSTYSSYSSYSNAVGFTSSSFSSSAFSSSATNGNVVNGGGGGDSGGGGGGASGRGSSGSPSGSPGSSGVAGTGGSGAACAGGPAAVEGSLALTELRLLFLPDCDAAAQPAYLEHHTVQIYLPAIKTISHRAAAGGARLLTVHVRDGRVFHFLVPAAAAAAGTNHHHNGRSSSSSSRQNHHNSSHSGSSNCSKEREWASGICSRSVSASRWCERVAEEIQWRRAANDFVDRFAAICRGGAPPAVPQTFGGGGGGGSGADLGVFAVKHAVRSVRSLLKGKKGILRKLFRAQKNRPVAGKRLSSAYVRSGPRYDAGAELKRIGADIPGSRWRVSHANAEYETIPTYPRALGFPANLSDAFLRSAAEHRSKRRLPALAWLHPETGAPLVRSAQPMTGALQRVLVEDINLLLSIREAAPLTKKLCIVDARPHLNARANQINGKGFEDPADLGGKAFVELHFMDIENIHVMRDSLAALMLGCQSRGPDFYTALASSGWLRHVSQILRGASFVAERLQRGWAVLVHCSDGWDRTAQLSALSQLLLDPYYRTAEGFEVLVEKEWCAFGHMFDWRCLSDGAECSPVFLQFLDAVAQLLHQFPDAFEFTRRYLLCLVDAAYSGIFETFTGNCEAERRKSRGLNAFDYINRYCGGRQSQPLHNSLYRPASASEPALRPCCDAQALQLWEEVYLRSSVILAHRARHPSRLRCLEQQLARERLSAQALRVWAASGAATAMALAAFAVGLLALAIEAVRVLGGAWSRLLW